MRILTPTIGGALLLAACSPAQPTTAAPSGSAPAAASSSPVSTAPVAAASDSPASSSSTPSAPAPAAGTDAAAGRVAAINAAAFNPAAPSPAKPAAGKPSPDDALIRAEVFLSRARFSPGVIDGLDGSNLAHALNAYQTAHGIAASGKLDAATWTALSGDPAAKPPAATVYTVTAEDVAGPFAADVGEDFVKLAALPDGPGFTSPLEALAERFHMSQALLTALNPGVDFKTAGVRIAVVDAAPPAFSKGDVAAIEVSKSNAEASAFDKDGKLIAFYPATVGSTDRPSPSGVHKVNGVAEKTSYVYDPKKLNWGPRGHGKLVIKPGPNGPVGTVWIDLNAPSYGIHGSPNPETIGKTASHGCVRLTNWDAEALAAGVKPGVKVTFEGARAKG